jgi:LacI family transcriptional regulator
MVGRTRESRANVTDVASLAGVSPGTVSNVFSRKPSVAPALRERVIAAARELHYTPHSVARALRTGRTRTIGLCVPLLTNPTIPAILQGASQAAYEAGYALTICTTEHKTDLEQAQLTALAQQRVAAVIALTVGADPEPYLELGRQGVPVVFEDHRPPKIAADLVAPDYYAGTLAALRHLFALGRRRVGLLYSLPHLSSNEARLRAYRDAHAEAGLVPSGDLAVSGLFADATARRAVEDLLRLPAPPDALVAGNGVATAASLAVLKSAGIAIPEDIALVGTGDVLWAALAEPSLTMIAVPGEAVGRLAVKAALERLEEEDLPESRDLYLPAPLVVRRSTSGR